MRLIFATAIFGNSHSKVGGQLKIQTFVMEFISYRYFSNAYPTGQQMSLCHAHFRYLPYNSFSDVVE